MPSGGGSTNTNTIQNTQPWAAQQPFITQGLNAADAQFNTATAAGPYTGNFTAQGNGYDAASINAANNYATGTGATLTDTLGQDAGTLAAPSVASSYIGNAGSIATNGIGPQDSALMNTLQGIGTGAQTTAGATPELSSALNSGAVTAANSLTGFTTGLSNAATTAAGNPTAQVEQNAQQYANSPQVQQAMAAADAPITQTLTEQTDPGLNRAAAMGGSLNSSRAGMAEGMANQGAATAIGSTNANIEDNALNTGLTTAAGLYSGNLNAAVSANTQGLAQDNSVASTTAGQQTALNLANTSNEMTAANSGLSQNQSFNTANANAELAGNAQLAAGLQMGTADAGAAQNQASGDATLEAGAGTLQTQEDQAALTNNLDQWNMQNQYEQGLINNYMNTAGQPLGTSANTSGTTVGSGPGVAGSVLGAGIGAAGLYNTANSLSGGTLGSGISGLFAPAVGASVPIAGTAGVMGAGAAGISSADAAGLVASGATLSAGAGAAGVGAAAGAAADAGIAAAAFA